MRTGENLGGMEHLAPPVIRWSLPHFPDEENSRLSKRMSLAKMDPPVSDSQDLNPVCRLQRPSADGYASPRGSRDG